MSASNMNVTRHLGGRVVAVAAVAVLLTVALVAALLARAGDGGSDAKGYALQVAAGAPGEQALLLADGTITKDEYEKALSSTIACLRAAGVNAQTTPGAGLKPLQIGFAADSLADAQRSDAALARCRAEHSQEVETVWGKQKAESLKAEAAPALSLLRECMRSNVGESAPPLNALTDLTHFLDVSVSAEGSRDPGTSRVVRAYFKTCKPLVEETIGVVLP